MAKNICGIVISETSSAEDARKRAEIMKDCPNLIVSGTFSNMFYSVYIVPEEKKWWLKIPETNAEEIGLKNAQVYIVENLFSPEKFDLTLPTKKTRIAPCGADCQTCSFREEYDCRGCPATVGYRE